jgi:ParB family chromosome partitioning protein
MAAKRGLGRGLGALIPDAAGEPAAVSPSAPGAPVAAHTDSVGATYRELPLDAVHPNPRQPRAVFDEDALAELVASIREIGLLQPIVVRETAPDRYELVAGERRLRASRAAGLQAVPAIIRHTDDDDMLRDALLENLHRADLNPLEEAAAYEQLLKDFGCTHDELARRVARSRPQVSNTLRLLRLPPGVQRRVAAGVLSAGHARALLSLEDADAMEELANRVVAEGLSVRAVEEIVLVGETGRRRQRRPRVPIPRDAQLTEALDGVATALADRLDTRVSAEGFGSARSRGRLVIECADVDDLRRIAAILDREA